MQWVAVMCLTVMHIDELFSATEHAPAMFIHVTVT